MGTAWIEPQGAAASSGKILPASQRVSSRPDDDLEPESKTKQVRKWITRPLARLVQALSTLFSRPAHARHPSSWGGQPGRPFRRTLYRATYGDNFVKRNGNSSVTSTRTNHALATSVARWVKVKTTSTMRRAPLRRDGCLVMLVRAASRPNCSAAVA